MTHDIQNLRMGVHIYKSAPKIATIPLRKGNATFRLPIIMESAWIF